MDKKIRFTEIDLLRFFAAFSVMFFHYTIRGHADGDSLSPIKFPFLATYSKYGYLGVDLFFVISGFVILMTAIDRSAREFVISRIVRLYPAYLVCCTITFIVTSIWGTPVLQVSLKRYLANMTMLHGFFPIGHVDGVYWTLFVEMKFYFLIFLLILFKQVTKIKFYLGGWLIVSILALRFFSGPLEAVFITKYSAYFIAGALFYLIYREGPDLFKITLLLGTYPLALTNAAQHMYIKSNWYHMSFNIYFVAGIIGLIYLVFLLIALNKTGWLRAELYIYLGAMTYPLYLLHSRIGFTVLSTVNSQINKYLLLVLLLLGMMGLAYLIHSQIEKRFAPRLKTFLERWTLHGVPK